MQNVDSGTIALARCLKKYVIGCLLSVPQSESGSGSLSKACQVHSLQPTSFRRIEELVVFRLHTAFLSYGRHDRDRDEYLNRKDFLAAIQSLGCATVCPPKQLNILFDAICEGEGMKSWGAFQCSSALQQPQHGRWLAGVFFSCFAVCSTTSPPLLPECAIRPKALAHASSCSVLSLLQAHQLTEFSHDCHCIFRCW